MNPETRLSEDEIKTICQRHGIAYVSHERITTGFSHEVHKLNDDLIIKIYDAEYYKNFMTEAAILQSNTMFPKARYVAAGLIDGDDRHYLIMSFVPGKSLGGMWHLASDEQRESLIKSICSALQTINKIDPSEIAADTNKSWKQQLLDKTNELVQKLSAKNIIDPTTANRTTAAIKKYAAALNADTQYVVFWDIHFDNFIVNEQFELLAVIDLESTMYATLDYPLFVLQKMTDLPHKYLREDEEKFADVKDYVHLIDWYRKYFPAMFAFDDLETRLKLYQLYDVLHLLQDWLTHQENHDELSRLIN